MVELEVRDDMDVQEPGEAPVFRLIVIYLSWLLSNNSLTCSASRMLFTCALDRRDRDGDLHLHATVCLRSRVNYRDPRRLDLTGPDELRFHGNYQGTRNVQNCIRYCKKDGNFLCCSELPAFYAIAEDKAESLTKVRQCDSEAGLNAYMLTNRLNHSANVLTRYWQVTRLQLTPEPNHVAESFIVPNVLAESVRLTLEGVDRVICKAMQ